MDCQDCILLPYFRNLLLPKTGRKYEKGELGDVRKIVNKEESEVDNLKIWNNRVPHSDRTFFRSISIVESDVNSSGVNKFNAKFQDLEARRF